MSFAQFTILPVSEKLEKWSKLLISLVTFGSNTPFWYLGGTLYPPIPIVSLGISVVDF